ncbi:MAG: YdeI/OmpD-associated family protein [Bacteroidales bacterium]|nr:YdeI/OmpD-associated family protein [Bacteroidales bacterium]
MEIGETLHVLTREEWRSWLEKNYDKAKDIWLVYANKKSGKPRIPYDEAVEEALCFGWIDSIVKRMDDHYAAQRFSPRRAKSQFSELNRVRVRKMIELGKMTEAGLKSLNHHLMVDNGTVREHKPFKMPKDIMAVLKKDIEVWKNFNAFPEDYRQVRIAYIDHARERGEEFEKRLNYFIKMTRQNKMFGSKV